MFDMSVSDKERFWSKVSKRSPEECWLWKGAPIAGYGQINIGGRAGTMHRAHRVSYFLHRGRFDKRLVVCHKCDTPLCVNPDHLFLGTQADNLKDMWRKGRARPGRSAGTNNGSAKINQLIAAEIRAAPGSVRQVAKQFGVGSTTVHEIRSGVRWAL